MEKFVDASFPAHADGYSHTGSVTVVYDIPTHYTSNKQTNVATSSSYAELNALSDRLDDALHINQYLKAQGEKVSIPIVYQNNQSTIMMVHPNAKNLKRTSMRWRQAFVRECVSDNLIKIEYMHTKQMMADILTKPLQAN